MTSSAIRQYEFGPAEKLGFEEVPGPVPGVGQVRVVVSSAAGGMGALLVQAAKNVGAYVIGLAGGPEKVALVRGLGADVAVDYEVEGWVVPREPTVVLDGVGGVVGRRLFELLGRGG